ncbi:hypothetical protein L873DRAFT_1811721 [Choiromyces venosus 120613-1]|uniref:Uncharacterized protein n=1 Tax=Choiromyces venosus 120613-1 TaxID=1336337 RepID=A0A3N4JDD6_9PEZI|nr:hypothetical protein L873DRAFT_1811721 [Choiromyces venosus 120613-1]
MKIWPCPVERKGTNRKRFLSRVGLVEPIRLRASTVKTLAVRYLRQTSNIRIQRQKHSRRICAFVILLTCQSKPILG